MKDFNFFSPDPEEKGIVGYYLLTGLLMLLAVAGLIIFLILRLQ